MKKKVIIASILVFIVLATGTYFNFFYEEESPLVEKGGYKILKNNPDINSRIISNEYYVEKEEYKVVLQNPNNLPIKLDTPFELNYKIKDNEVTIYDYDQEYFTLRITDTGDTYEFGRVEEITQFLFSEGNKCYIAYINPDGSQMRELGATTYVLEDGKCTNVKEVKSLKGTPIVPRIEFDGINNPTILDYNLTSIQIKNNVNAPVSVYKVKSITDVDKKNLAKQLGKGINAVVREDYYTKKNKGNAKANDEFIINDFTIGDIIHIGETSTNITLQDQGSELMQDADYNKLSPSANGGDKVHMDVNNGSTQEVHIVEMWNITQIPAGVTIDLSILYLDPLSISCADGVPQAHNVSSDWGTKTVTWGTPPTRDPNIINITTCDAGTTKFDITALVKDAFDNQGLAYYTNASDNVFSAEFMMTRASASNSLDNVGGANDVAADQPKLNISFTVPNVAPTTPTSLNPVNNTLISNQTQENTKVNLSWNNSADTDTVTYNLDVANTPDFTGGGENLTGGFGVLAVGSGSGRGVAKDTSDDTFWISDTGDAFIFHVDIEGNNITDGISISDLGSDSLGGVYYDERNDTLWVISNNPAFIIHVNASDGSNLSDGFPYVTSANDVQGITYQASNNTFFLYDDTNKFVLHFNGSTKANITDGFLATTTSASLDGTGLTLDTRDDSLWILDTANDFFYNVDLLGNNQTKGFPVGGFGATSPGGLSYDSSNDTIWLYDGANDFVYRVGLLQGIVHSVSAITEGGTNITSYEIPINLNVSHYSWRVRGDDTLLNGTYGFANFSIVLDPFASNVTIINTTTAQVGSDINGSFNVNDDFGGKLNATVRWYKDDLINLTLQQLNNYDSGTTVFSSENITLNDFNTWILGVNISNGIASSVQVNSTSFFPQNNLPVISNIVSRTLWNDTDGDYNLYSQSDYVNVTVTDVDAQTIKVNITIIDPDDIVIINNLSMQNVTADDFNLSESFIFNKTGTYPIRIVASDGLSSVTSNASINIHSSILSTVKGFIASILEGLANPFSLNVSYDNRGANITNSSLRYNNTDNEAVFSDLNGTFRTFSKNLTAPLVTGNGTAKPFFWNTTISYVNNDLVHENTSNSTQTISDFVFNLCNTTLTQVAVNYTFQDELNFTSLSMRIPTSTFNFSLATTPGVQNQLLFIDASEKPSYSFCTNLNQDFNLNASIDYVNSIYSQRQFSEDAIFSGNHTNRTLYSLFTADGLFVVFQVLNQAQQPLSGVEVTAQKVVNGTLQVIEQRDTDDAGAATFFLDPTASHRMTFEKEGFATLIRNIVPSTSSFTIIMGTSTPTNGTSINLGIEYEIIPSNTTLNNNTVLTFGFNLTSGLFTLDEFGFRLTNKSGATLNSTSSVAGQGGFVTVSHNTENQTFIIMDAFWFTNGTYANVSKTYFIRPTFQGDFSILTFFDDLQAFAAGGENEGLNQETLALIAFVIIFAAVILAMKQGFVDSTSKAGYIIVPLVLLFEFVGMIPTIGIKILGNSIPFVSIVTALIFIGFLLSERSRL